MQNDPPLKEEVRFTVIEKFKVEKTAQPVVNIEKPKPPPPVAPPRKKVYGVTRKSITSTKGGVSAKRGNTLAKTPDTEILDKDNEDALPIPAEEFLISSMPKVLEEIRPQYPIAAKKNGIEGSVVLEVLIDADGKVRQATVIKSLTDAMDVAAKKAMEGFSFRPATIGDKPVAVKIKYSIRFVLEKS